ncbi:hypothetical protein [Gracilibacillus xinjiangensis]|uniref:PH domain-containing protein n=1 Tax=Gracilibacillus xinjiangensis TaxID=1193282 RepID=A0ABV8WTF4_9BACI
MNYTYGNSDKWRNKGISSLINVLIVFVAWIIIFASSQLSQVFFLIISAILLFFVCSRIYKAVYFFRLANKDYVIIDQQSLILNGQFTPKKQVSFAQIKEAAEVNETLVIKLENGGEEVIYLDWLDKEDSLKLLEQLQGKIGSLHQSS